MLKRGMSIWQALDFKLNEQVVEWFIQKGPKKKKRKEKDNPLCKEMLFGQFGTWWIWKTCEVSRWWYLVYIRPGVRPRPKIQAGDIHVWRTKTEKTGGNQEIDAFFMSSKNLKEYQCFRSWPRKRTQKIKVILQSRTTYQDGYEYIWYLEFATKMQTPKPGEGRDSERMA